jgi:hypothetical protein
MTMRTGRAGYCCASAGASGSTVSIAAARAAGRQFDLDIMSSSVHRA